MIDDNCWFGFYGSVGLCYILDLLTTDGFASFEGVGALPFGIVSDPGPCWPSSCFLTGKSHRCSGRYVKDGGRPE